MATCLIFKHVISGFLDSLLDCVMTVKNWFSTHYCLNFSQVSDSFWPTPPVFIHQMSLLHKNVTRQISFIIQLKTYMHSAIKEVPLQAKYVICTKNAQQLVVHIAENTCCVHLLYVMHTCVYVNASDRIHMTTDHAKYTSLLHYVKPFKCFHF